MKKREKTSNLFLQPHDQAAPSQCLWRQMRADTVRCSPEFGGAQDPGERDTVSFHQPSSHSGSGSLPAGRIQRTGQPVDDVSLQKHSSTFKQTLSTHKQTDAHTRSIKSSGLFSVCHSSFCNLKYFLYFLFDCWKNDLLVHDTDAASHTSAASDWWLWSFNKNLHETICQMAQRLTAAWSTCHHVYISILARQLFWKGSAHSDQHFFHCKQNEMTLFKSLAKALTDQSVVTKWSGNYFTDFKNEKTFFSFLVHQCFYKVAHRFTGKATINKNNVTL